jgi:euchromatic histone-lysine N-methyltransferase
MQRGIVYRLEVFKTATRGYGLRTLQTIPMGAFVCAYFGELLSDAAAEHEDDTYLFDLDAVQVSGGVQR